MFNSSVGRTANARVSQDQSVPLAAEPTARQGLLAGRRVQIQPLPEPPTHTPPLPQTRSLSPASLQSSSAQWLTPNSEPSSNAEDSQGPSPTPSDASGNHLDGNHLDGNHPDGNHPDGSPPDTPDSPPSSPRERSLSPQEPISKPTPNIDPGQVTPNAAAAHLPPRHHTPIQRNLSYVSAQQHQVGDSDASLTPHLPPNPAYSQGGSLINPRSPSPASPDDPPSRERSLSPEHIYEPIPDIAPEPGGAAAHFLLGHQPNDDVPPPLLPRLVPNPAYDIVSRRATSARVQSRPLPTPPESRSESPRYHSSPGPSEASGSYAKISDSEISDGEIPDGEIPDGEIPRQDSLSPPDPQE